MRRRFYFTRGKHPFISGFIIHRNQHRRVELDFEYDAIHTTWGSDEDPIILRHVLFEHLRKAYRDDPRIRWALEILDFIGVKEEEVHDVEVFQHDEDRNYEWEISFFLNVPLCDVIERWELIGIDLGRMCDVPSE